MTAPEPLSTTLEELAVLHGIVVWKDPASEAWVAGYPRYISPHSLEWEPLGIGATWPEAASDALHRPVVARDEAAELRAAVREFFKAEAAVAALYHPNGIYTDFYEAADIANAARENLRRLAASEGQS